MGRWYSVTGQSIDDPEEMELLLITGESASGARWYGVAQFNDGDYRVPEEGTNSYDTPTHYMYIGDLPDGETGMTSPRPAPPTRDTGLQGRVDKLEKKVHDLYANKEYSRSRDDDLLFRIVGHNKRLHDLEALENDRIQHKTYTPYADMKAQAAQQQATEHLYAPLRSDTRAVVDLAAFARRLIDMQDLGHAVTEEVRVLAKRALGVGQ